MARGYEMPQPADVTVLLEALFGRRPEVRQGGNAEMAKEAFLGVYRDQQGQVHGICAFDRRLAIAVSAALSLIPPAKIEEIEKTPELPAILVENLHEVFNICVRFFTSYSEVSMRLQDVIQTGTAIAPDVAACVAEAKRCNFLIKLPGYGGGVMRLFLVGG